MKYTKVDYIGKIFDSRSTGKFEIVKELIPVGYPKDQRVFVVRFLDTGFTTTATLGTIYGGRIRDRMIPSVKGVGYLGQPDNIYLYANYPKPFYRTWKAMIGRCYDTEYDEYQKYGALGVTVCDRWKCYENFYKDIQQIHGYDRKIKDPNHFELDKDFLQSNLPISQRVYSKDTCLWLSHLENGIVRGKDNSAYNYYGISSNHGDYYTRIFRDFYGRFKSAEEAAALFNYLYPYLIDPWYNTINIQNNVPFISLEELLSRNLIQNKTALDRALQIISSTTIL